MVRLNDMVSEERIQTDGAPLNVLKGDKLEGKISTDIQTDSTHLMGQKADRAKGTNFTDIHSHSANRKVKGDKSEEKDSKDIQLDSAHLKVQKGVKPEGKDNMGLQTNCMIPKGGKPQGNDNSDVQTDGTIPEVQIGNKPQRKNGTDISAGALHVMDVHTVKIKFTESDKHHVRFINGKKFEEKGSADIRSYQKEAEELKVSNQIGGNKAVKDMDKTGLNNSVSHTNRNAGKEQETKIDNCLDTLRKEDENKLNTNQSNSVFENVREIGRVTLKSEFEGQGHASGKITEASAAYQISKPTEETSAKKDVEGRNISQWDIQNCIAATNKEHQTADDGGNKGQIVDHSTGFTFQKNFGASENRINLEEDKHKENKRNRPSKSVKSKLASPEEMNQRRIAKARRRFVKPNEGVRNDGVVENLDLPVAGAQGNGILEEKDLVSSTSEVKRQNEDNDMNVNASGIHRMVENKDKIGTKPTFSFVDNRDMVVTSTSGMERKGIVKKKENQRDRKGDDAAVNFGGQKGLKEEFCNDDISHQLSALSMTGTEIGRDRQTKENHIVVKGIEAAESKDRHVKNSGCMNNLQAEKALYKPRTVHGSGRQDFGRLTEERTKDFPQSSALPHINVGDLTKARETCFKLSGLDSVLGYKEIEEPLTPDLALEELKGHQTNGEGAAKMEIFPPALALKEEEIQNSLIFIRNFLHQRQALSAVNKVQISKGTQTESVTEKVKENCGETRNVESVEEFQSRLVGRRNERSRNMEGRQQGFEELGLSFRRKKVDKKVDLRRGYVEDIHRKKDDVTDGKGNGRRGNVRDSRRQGKWRNLLLNNDDNDDDDDESSTESEIEEMSQTTEEGVSYNYDSRAEYEHCDDNTQDYTDYFSNTMQPMSYWDHMYNMYGDNVNQQYANHWNLRRTANNEDFVHSSRTSKKRNHSKKKSERSDMSAYSDWWYRNSQAQTMPPYMNQFPYLPDWYKSYPVPYSPFPSGFNMAAMAHWQNSFHQHRQRMPRSQHRTGLHENDDAVMAKLCQFANKNW